MNQLYIKKKFSALVVLSWKSSIAEAFSFLDQALKIDSKCDYAYETLGTLYIQTYVTVINYADLFTIIFLIFLLFGFDTVIYYLCIVLK